jgi:hypothetical protein
MPGKRIQFDDETWHALNLLAHDRMQDFQELADEAFRDLLAKHGRPTDLKTALRRSAGVAAEKQPVEKNPAGQGRAKFRKKSSIEKRIGQVSSEPAASHRKRGA